MSAFVISIQNEVIDFARKCIIFAHHTHSMCWHQLVVDAWHFNQFWHDGYLMHAVSFQEIGLFFSVIHFNHHYNEWLAATNINMWKNRLFWKQERWVNARALQRKKNTHTQLRMVSPSWQRYATLLCLCSKHKTTTMNKKNNNGVLPSAAQDCRTYLKSSNHRPNRAKMMMGK